MTRLELAAAVAGVLLVAFALGWLAHWAWAWLQRAEWSRYASREDRADELAAELLALEAARDEAEAEARSREAAFRSDAEETQAGLESRLREREAELAATMDGLRAARAEIEAMRRG